MQVMISENEKHKNVEVVKAYFAAFNRSDSAAMLTYLHPEVAHEINQGQVQVGIDQFRSFMKHMDECYKESLQNIDYFVSESGSKVSAEFDVHGTYLKTDGALPQARNQKYAIRAGSFFEIKEGLIVRVTTYYNLPLWVKMVSEWA